MSNIVARHKSVKAVGAGMSWSRNQIGCAAAGGANMLTAGICETPELTAAIPFYLAPPTGTVRVSTTDIVVNETDATVRVAACVTIQALLEFLAAYRTREAPGGYMLPYPSTTFVGQTVGGAISTATYGASLVHGSWSAKLLEAAFMNGAGTVVRNVTRASRPLLFKALKTSAGRLGILLEVKLAIERQRTVELSFQTRTMPDFLKDVRQTAEHIKVAMGLRVPPASCNGQLPCAQFDQNLRAMQNQLEAAVLEKANVHLVVEEAKPLSITWSVPTLGAPGSFVPQPLPNEDKKARNRLDWLAYLEGTFFASPNAAHTWAEALKQTTLAGDHLWKHYANPDGETSAMWYADPKSCLAQSSARADLPVMAKLLEGNLRYMDRIEQSPEAYHRWTDLIKGGACYNTTSLGVPYDKAAECLEALAPVLPSLLNPHRQKMTIGLRFTGVDDSFLSPMGRVPRLWVGIDTFHGEDIPPGIIEVLRGDKCGASMHWSTHGLGGSWVDPKAPRNSTIEQLGPDWCRFGCLAMQHDPTSKFEGHGWAREMWSFSAYDPVAHRILSAGAFNEHCCSTPGDTGEATFDTGKCVCAANILEGSDKAQMACHLMKNVDFRSQYCPAPGAAVDWALMLGCDWNGFKDAHHTLDIAVGRDMPDGCTLAPPPPFPPPFVRPPPPAPPIPPSPPPPPPPVPAPPAPEPVAGPPDSWRWEDLDERDGDGPDPLGPAFEYSMPPAVRVGAIVVSLVLELLCLYRLWFCFCVAANAGRTKIADGPDDGGHGMDSVQEEGAEEYGEEDFVEDYDGDGYAEESREAYLNEYDDDRRPKERSGSQRTYNNKDPSETVLD